MNKKAAVYKRGSFLRGRRDAIFRRRWEMAGKPKGRIQKKKEDDDEEFWKKMRRQRELMEKEYEEEQRMRKLWRREYGQDEDEWESEGEE